VIWLGRVAAQQAQRGQTLVEMALIVPLFLMLMLGLLDFGRVLYAQHTFDQAAREGTRLALADAANTGTKYSAIRSAVVGAAPGTGLTGAEVSGLGCSDCFYPDDVGSGGRVFVQVSKQVDLLTPLVGQLLGGSFTVQARSMAFIP
jgi:Flp pilus assembly protein TadG